LPDGSIILQLALGGLEEIERWILSWGNHVRVLEPAPLRAMIRDAASAIARLYSNLESTPALRTAKQRQS
jgi:predicted DNA-binding transcriptional regulator YafY